MSKAVVCTGRAMEFMGDEEVTHVTVADGVTEIKRYAFSGCKGLTNLSFLKGSVIMTIGEGAFEGSGIIILLGMEDVRKIGSYAFAECQDLRTIEGLGCEEMGEACFWGCTLLQSMKGWPASMTVIPYGTFHGCTGMTTVDCDLAHVTSIGANAFAGCTSLLPPSLSASGANPVAILAYLKRKSKDERIAARTAFLSSLKHAQSHYYNHTGDPCGASRRIIMEFAGLFPA
ncbi:hypothetical protein TeGR_g9275 [Tetraparma gracilis]|uniref:Leucine-rich repeat domain-containing protein n=1 Tax=Tetraparma gracilis TaxID=2962635 RepID=A0ABQ6MVV1_9STRA|nr:hypothetical protein TeGR_g9275 [Tetraparma gracilis]